MPTGYVIYLITELTVPHHTEIEILPFCIEYQWHLHLGPGATAIITVSISNFSIVIQVKILNISQLRTFSFNHNGGTRRCHIIINLFLRLEDTVCFSQIKFSQRSARFSSCLTRINIVSISTITTQTQYFVIHRSHIQQSAVLKAWNLVFPTKCKLEALVAQAGSIFPRRASLITGRNSNRSLSQYVTGLWVVIFCTNSQTLVKEAGIKTYIHRFFCFPNKTCIHQFHLSRTRNNSTTEYSYNTLVDSSDIIPIANGRVTKTTPVTSNLQIINPRHIKEFLLWDSPGTGEWGEITPTVFLSQTGSTVTTEGSSQIVFIIINVVSTSQIRNHRILTDTVWILLVALSGIQYCQIITVTQHREVQTGSPQTFPFMVLVSSTDHGIHMMLTKILIEVQRVLNQHVVGVVACLLAFRITVFLILSPVTFSTEPWVLIEIKVNTTVEFIRKEFERLEFQP